MQKNGKNKVLERILSMVFACLLFAGSIMPAYASDTANLNDLSSLKQKCNSVFEVNLAYVDAQGEAHVVKSGAGFLIGNGEEASYVLTSSENIDVNEELRTLTIHEYDLAQDAEIQFIPKLVVKSDVVIDAEIVVSSEEMGFAVLKLKQPIYGREALYFAAQPQDVQAMDTVYSIWSPDKAIEGQVFKWLEEGETAALWHNAVSNGHGSGNPLIDQYGNVIGVNTKMLETGYVETVSITEVMAVLDVFGVPYTIAGEVEPGTFTEQVESLDGQRETSAGQQEVFGQQDTVLETEQLTPLFWVGIGIVVLLLVGIVLLICRIAAADKKKEKDVSDNRKNKEKRQEKKDTEQAPAFTPSFSPYNQQVPFSDETTVLGMSGPMDMEATTVLSGTLKREESKGYLVREKTGERISLGKSLFVIGTDGLRVDYCIKDNKSVSRVHAQIRQINGEITLENLHATNGTYLNGVKLQDAEVKILHQGDSIRLANEGFQFLI